MKELEQLKEIFLSDDIDSEDYQENLDAITEWEQSLIENENLLSWQEHDITKQIISEAKSGYVALSIRLAKNRKLTDEERASIYAKQDAMIWLISLGGDDPKSVVEQIHGDIKKALNAT